MCDSERVLRIDDVGEIRVRREVVEGEVDVVWVEDEPGVIGWMLDKLRDAGCRVASVRSIVDAERIFREQDPKVIVADAKLGGKGGPATGNVWLGQRFRERPDIRRAVVTGRRAWVENEVELRDAGVSVLSKAETERLDEFIVDACKHVEERRASEQEALKARVRQALQPRAGLGQGTSELLTGVQGLFIQWLRSQDSPSELDVIWGEKKLSLDDLAAEVESGSEMGARLMKFFVRAMKRRMGI